MDGGEGGGRGSDVVLLQTGSRGWIQRHVVIGGQRGGRGRGCMPPPCGGGAEVLGAWLT